MLRCMLPLAAYKKLHATSTKLQRRHQLTNAENRRLRLRLKEQEENKNHEIASLRRRLEATEAKANAAKRRCKQCVVLLKAVTSQVVYTRACKDT